MLPFHITVRSGKLFQAVWKFTDHGGVGYLVQEDVDNNNIKTVAKLLWEKYMYTRNPLAGYPQCSAFEEYDEIPEMVILNLLDYKIK